MTGGRTDGGRDTVRLSDRARSRVNRTGAGSEESRVVAPGSGRGLGTRSRAGRPSRLLLETGPTSCGVNPTDHRWRSQPEGAPATRVRSARRARIERPSRTASPVAGRRAARDPFPTAPHHARRNEGRVDRRCLFPARADTLVSIGEDPSPCDAAGRALSLPGGSSSSLPGAVERLRDGLGRRVACRIPRRIP